MLIQAKSLCGLVEGSHKVVVTVEEVLLIVSKGDLAATIFRKEDDVAFFDSDGLELPVIKSAARADSDDSSEVQLLLLALRK
jgi:hypothetical protein